MFVRTLRSWCFLKRVMFLFSASVLVPSMVMAEVAVYEGTLEVVKTSGALCGSHEKRVYPVEVVVNRSGRGIDGYFHGRDVSTGHFTGAYLSNLKVSYACDDAKHAEGHLLSLQATEPGLAGELREKQLSATDEDCSFDLALLNLRRESGRDGEKAWRQSSALWQIELLNRRTFAFTTSGRYKEAVETAQRSLHLCERYFGADSAESAVPLSNLAVVYRRLGRYSEAEPLCKRVLAAAESTLGTEHPTVAIRLINLAELYEDTRRYSEAEPLYKRALKIYVKAWGPEHPDAAKVLNNLAVLYQADGRYQEAEPLYQRAISIMKKAYGPDHPSIATLTRNLDELRKKHHSVKTSI